MSVLRIGMRVAAKPSVTPNRPPVEGTVVELGPQLVTVVDANDIPHQGPYARWRPLPPLQDPTVLQARGDDDDVPIVQIDTDPATDGPPLLRVYVNDALVYPVDPRDELSTLRFHADRLEQALGEERERGRRRHDDIVRQANRIDVLYDRARTAEREQARLLDLIAAHERRQGEDKRPASSYDRELWSEVPDA